MTVETKPETIHVHADQRWVDPEWGFAGEGLWATRVGGLRAKVANTPFFLKGVHLDDVVTLDGSGEILAVELSGTRTFTAILADEAADRVDKVKQGLMPDAPAEGGLSGAMFVLSARTEEDVKAARQMFALLKRLKLVRGWQEG